MNNTITITQFSNETFAQDRKIAKLSKEKASFLLKRFKEGLAKIQQPLVNNTPSKQVTKDYQGIMSAFNITCYRFNDTTIPTGARKLKVNPIVSNSASEMYNKCAIDSPVNVKTDEHNIVESTTIPVAPVEAPKEMDNNFLNNSFNTRVSRLEAMAPVETKKEPVVEQPITNPINNQHESQNVSISVDDYLQQNTPKDDYKIKELSENNEKLKDEIIKSQSYVEQLEQQYNELMAMKEQRLNALEEEKLTYTTTLNGLTEKIRNLQEAINKEKQTLGR